MYNLGHNEPYYLHKHTTTLQSTAFSSLPTHARTHARTHTRAPHAYTPHRRAGARAPTHTHHMHTHTPHARAGTHTRTHARTHTEERPSQSRGEKKGLEGRFK